jgi:glucosamine-6-phosphate deaminase|tara:strand:+ start:4552 stop:5220 length:669 start_codon:yes stop_codon:yes gene_type:complete
MKVKKLNSYKELSSTVADIVEEQLVEKVFQQLVLPTGSTPIGLYKELAKRNLNWSYVRTFNLDVYIMNPNHSQSYQTFMKENLFNRINIYPDNCHFPFRPTLAYEDKINYFGGVDLCILGIGSNGHIAFNEPGSSFKSRTRVVDLDEQTIQDNSRFFDSVDDVPKQAITMGIGTIMESKKIILMASGDHKKDILEKALNGKVTEDVPASVLQTHKNVEVYYH